MKTVDTKPGADWLQLTDPTSPNKKTILASQKSNFTGSDADVVAYVDERGWTSIWRNRAECTDGDELQRRKVREERWRKQIAYRAEATPPSRGNAPTANAK